MIISICELRYADYSATPIILFLRDCTFIYKLHLQCTCISSTNNRFIINRVLLLHSTFSSYFENVLVLVLLNDDRIQFYQLSSFSNGSLHFKLGQNAKQRSYSTMNSSLPQHRCTPNAVNKLVIQKSIHILKFIRQCEQLIGRNVLEIF